MQQRDCKRAARSGDHVVCHFLEMGTGPCKQYSHIGSAPRLFVVIGVEQSGEPGGGRDAGGYNPSRSF